MLPALLSPLLFLAQTGDAAVIQKGTFTFRPAVDEKDTPKRYQLEERKVDWEMTPSKTLPISGIDVFELRFPSAVKSAYAENNTVHAEYYRPRKKGPLPCVIILDITGGDQSLSRMFARHLAQNDIAGLFVQMAYYGPRRPKEGKVRFLSYDVNHTMEAVRQTVLDLRLATAWMESQPDLDKTKLGIMGTSLGSFVAALTAEMEPKLDRVALLLGGGGFVDGFYDHPLADPYRKVYEAFGGTKKMVEELLAPVDPLTYAEKLKSRKLLMVAAKKDEIVPPRMAERLWKASGEQKIIWLNAGHYSAALYLITGLDAIVEHFKK